MTPGVGAPRAWDLETKLSPISRRRAVALIGALIAAQANGRAFTQARKPLLAMLLVGSRSEAAGRLAALAELGWVDGRTIDMAIRYADGDLARVPALLDELVALNPDVIFTHTGEAARAAAAATRTIPVVIGAAGEEALVEVAGNITHPTGNITGLTLVSQDQHIKVVELLKEAQPSLVRLAVLANPHNGSYRNYPETLAPVLGPLRLEAVRVEASDEGDLGRAFQAVAASGAQALLVTADPSFNRSVMHRRINDLARAQKVAVGATFDAFAREGGLLSLGTDYNVLYRRAATYVDKLLRGAKPSDLPIERPSIFKLILNLKTADALGLSIPASLSARADDVIE